MTPQDFINAVVLPPATNTRDGVIYGFLGALRAEIKARKRTATSNDLWAVDFLYICIQELRLLRGLDKSGVGQRIKELAEYKPADDIEKIQVEASKCIIGAVGKAVKKYINTP